MTRSFALVAGAFAATLAFSGASFATGIAGAFEKIAARFERGSAARKVEAQRPESLKGAREAESVS